MTIIHEFEASCNVSARLIPRDCLSYTIEKREMHPIDIDTRSEIDTLLLPGSCDCNSVDVCSDGSVLAASLDCNRVYRLTIDAAGNLSYTGESLDVGGLGKDVPNNVVCGPGGKSGFTALAWNSPEVLSFGIPGLGPVDDRTLSGACGESGLVNPSGTVAYVRSVESGEYSGFVDAWSYDPATGSLGLSPLLSFPISDDLPGDVYLGIKVMAIHPNGAKLYVTEPGKLNVYDSGTGALLKSITDASIPHPAGVCIAPPSFSTGSTVPFDIKPGVCPNPLYPSLRGKLPAAILGFAGFDVNRIDPASVRLEGIAPLKYEYQDVAAPFVPFTGKSDCKKDCTTAGPDGYLDLVLYFDKGVDLVCDEESIT
jgi:hypothetical protein